MAVRFTHTWKLSFSRMRARSTPLTTTYRLQTVKRPAHEHAL
jgi:hypothetical protein